MKSGLLSKTAGILISSSSSISFETKHFNMPVPLPVLRHWSSLGLGNNKKPEKRIALTLKTHVSEKAMNISDHLHLSCTHVFLTAQFKEL